MSGLNSEEMYAKKTHLEVGDIAIGGGCIIERKSIQNLYSDIVDNNSSRPWSQLRDMKDNFESVHLICHGVEKDFKSWKKNEDEREKERRRKMKVALNSGISIGLDWNINFWKVDSSLDLFEIVNNLFNREIGQKRSSKPYSAVKRTASMKERISAILCNVPGIGPSRAEKLLKEKKSLKEITKLDKNEMQDILGNKTGKNLYEVINGEIN